MYPNIESTYKPLLLVAFLCIFTNPAYAETTIGRWCDITVPGNTDYNSIKEIVSKDDGTFELRIRYGDGSESANILFRKSRWHYDTMNTHGEEYRIIQSTGELELLDADGPFRTASPLGTTPVVGECGI